MKKKQLILLLAGLAAVATLVTVPALATPGSGASGAVVARGLNVEKIKTRGNDPADVVVQQLAIAPGGYTGWHTHPGNAIAIVKSGTLTIYDAQDESCEGRDYPAGSVYLDPGYGHVHMGRNEGSTPLEIVVTYLDVPINGGFRIDAEAGACTF